MISIMHILYSFDVGGLETGIANLINHMDAEKFSHSICVFSKRTSALEKVENKNIKLHIIKRNFRNDPVSILRLASLLRKNRPDIVRTYNWGGMDGVIAARLSGIRAIVHSEHGFDIEEIYKKKRRRILLRRAFLRQCIRVIAVSHVLKTWLINDVKIPEDKVVFIPNGYDTKLFFPGKDRDKRRDLGIKDGEIVIATVGALKKLKNQRCLIGAFAGLSKAYHNLRLMLVGEGPLRADLENFATGEGIREKVIFTGEVAQTASLYRTMDIFVLPSLCENAPNVLLEAMASGLPIVASDVGDVRHMLEAGKGGIIVKPGDLQEIEEGIKYFLENPSQAQEKGNFACTKAKESFDIKKIKLIYESLYASLLISLKQGDV